MDIARRQPLDDVAGKTANRSSLRDPEENPRSLAMTLDKSRFDEELEVAGDAWLRLAKDRHQFTDREFRLGDKRKQA